MLKATAVQRSTCFKFRVCTWVPHRALQNLLADRDVNKRFVTIGGIVSAYMHASSSPHSGHHTHHGNTIVLSTGLVVLSVLLWYSDKEQLYEIMSYARYAVICNSACHKHCFQVFFYFKLALSLVRNSAPLQCDTPA